MVRIWIADITSLLIEETYRAYYDKVPVWRREKADKYVKKDDRARSIGAWTLWQKMQKTYRLPEDAVFNLSHSGRYVLCACSDRQDVQVGCDVEMKGELLMPIAERYFCTQECEQIRSGKDEKERTDWFYRFWVLKESFMKATRKGMGLDMRTYEFAWDRRGVPYMKKQPSEYQKHYICREYLPEQGDARIAVITTDPDIEGSLHEVRLA